MMKFSEFKNMAQLSMEEICRDTFRKNQDSIKIKKEAVAVKNLAAIFHTTLRLSNEKGFQTMSLRELSRASGLSMGALYSYFTSKDELLEMIQDQGRRLILKIMAAVVDMGAPATEKLRAAIRGHLYLTEVMQPWFYFSYMETKNLDKRRQKKAIEGELATEKLFIDILEEGIRSNDFQAADPVLTASLLKAMLQDWYLKRWKYAGRRISVDQYADFLVGFMESAIRPKSSRDGKN
jgi:TetR/AcrR family transcriptional regulator, cholesterol catabolism regulator